MSQGATYSLYHIRSDIYCIALLTKIPSELNRQCVRGSGPDRDELRENGGMFAAGEELPQVRRVRSETESFSTFCCCF